MTLKIGHFSFIRLNSFRNSEYNPTHPQTGLQALRTPKKKVEKKSERYEVSILDLLESQNKTRMHLAQFISAFSFPDEISVPLGIHQLRHCLAHLGWSRLHCRLMCFWQPGQPGMVRSASSLVEDRSQKVASFTSNLPVWPSKISPWGKKAK